MQPWCHWRGGHSRAIWSVVLTPVVRLLRTLIPSKAQSVAGELNPCWPPFFVPQPGRQFLHSEHDESRALPEWTLRALCHSNPLHSTSADQLRPEPVPSCRSQCPKGTPIPRPCPSGTYSSLTSLATEAQCEICGLGSFCPLAASAQELCAAGRFGDTRGQTTRQCTGACAAGHYCEEGSTSSTAAACRKLPHSR